MIVKLIFYIILILILFKFHYIYIFETINIVKSSGKNDYCQNIGNNELDDKLCSLFNKKKKFFFIYYDGFPLYMMKKLIFPKNKGYLMKINNIGLCDSGPSMHTIFSCDLTLTYRSSILNIDNVIEKLNKRYDNDFKMLGNDYTLDLLDIKKIKEYKKIDFGFHQIFCEDFLDWQPFYYSFKLKKRFSDEYIEDEVKINNLIDEKLKEYREILKNRKTKIFECLKKKIINDSYFFYIMRSDNLAHIFTRQHPNFIKGTSMILANLEILIEFINIYDKDRIIVSTTDHGAADSYYHNEYVNHEKTFNNYNNYSYLFLYSNKFNNLNNKNQFLKLNSNHSAGIYSLFLGINIPVYCKISPSINYFNDNLLKLFYLRNMHNSLKIKYENLNINKKKFLIDYKNNLNINSNKVEIDKYEKFLLNLEKRINNLKQDNLFYLNMISYILSLIFFLILILPSILNKNFNKLVIFELFFMFTYIFIFFDVPNEKYFRFFCFVFIFINSIYSYIYKKRIIEFYILLSITFIYILFNFSMVIPYIFFNLQNSTMAIITGIYLLYITWIEVKNYSFKIKFIYIMIDILLIIRDIYFSLQINIFFQIFPDLLDHSLLIFYIGFVLFHCLFDKKYGRKKLVLAIIQTMYIFINHYEKIVYLVIFYYLFEKKILNYKFIDETLIISLIFSSFYLNLVTERMFDWKPRERLQNRLPYKGLYMNIGFL